MLPCYDWDQVDLKVTEHHLPETWWVSARVPSGRTLSRVVRVASLDQDAFS